MRPSCRSPAGNCCGSTLRPQRCRTQGKRLKAAQHLVDEVEKEQARHEAEAPPPADDSEHEDAGPAKARQLEQALRLCSPLMASRAVEAGGGLEGVAS